MLKSPVKWLSDDKYSKCPFQEKGIAWADSQVGVRENGRNKGKQVETYQEVAGLGKGGGFAWCACFVYWTLIMSGVLKGSLPKPGICAAVINWVKWAKSEKRLLSNCKRGYLFYWLNADGTGHIGYCVSPMVLGVFRTIEGNTDGESGSREGDGVYKRTRTIWQLKAHKEYGFINLENL